MKPTKSNHILLALALLALFAGNIVAAPLGTAFTYQGRLSEGTNAANGNYDLRFTLFDAGSGGSPIAGTNADTGVIVTNGEFNVTLDFGNVFTNGMACWLEISVRTNGGGDFTMLNPRQPILPVPYAIVAENVLPDGLLAGTYRSAVVLNNTNNSFTGDGGGLKNLNASRLASGTVPLDRLGTLLYGDPFFSGNPVFTGAADFSGFILLQNGLAGTTLWSITVGDFEAPNGGGSYPDSLLFSADGTGLMVVAPGFGVGIAGNLACDDKIIGGTVKCTNIDMREYGTINFPDFGSINFAGFGSIAGDPEMGGGIGFSTDVHVYGNIHATNNIEADGDISANKNISCYQIDVNTVNADGIYASGEIIVNGDITSETMHVNGNISADGDICGMTWCGQSDRNAKEKFAAIDSREVLERVVSLPISRWNFKKDTATQHIGPMAQDFYAAFNVGPDDKHITSVDADGVALAAIQGLNRKLANQLKIKDTEIQSLKQRLDKLEQVLTTQNR